MFSGIGGFELGIGEHGECVGYSEIDKYAIQVYEKHFKFKECNECKEDREHIQGTERRGLPPIRYQSDAESRGHEQSETWRDREFQQPKNNCKCENKNYGDATTINASELPDFDLLVGGFPCQAFSIAGKRLGLDDTRGTLFYDIARIAKEKRPQHLLLENVKGLLSHDNGRTFKLILSTFTELGYNLEWQVLNSKNFGVPQNRERVFIVGHLGRCCGRQVFPFGEADRKINEGITSTTIDANYWKGIDNHGARTAIVQLNQPTHSNDRVYGTDGISPTLNTMQGGNRQPFIQENIKIRRLTPVECERLQGFPDGWTEGISDTQRYKCLGNAVTVNVVTEIAYRMFQ